MSAKAKKKSVDDSIDLSATYTILHMVTVPNPQLGMQRKGQPCWADGSNYTSVGHMLGQHKMTHLEVLRLYQDACKREEAARKMREFWGEVVTNWDNNTEKLEDDGSE